MGQAIVKSCVRNDKEQNESKWCCFGNGGQDQNTDENQNFDRKQAKEDKIFEEGLFKKSKSKRFLANEERDTVFAAIAQKFDIKKVKGQDVATKTDNQGFYSPNYFRVNLNEDIETKEMENGEIAIQVVLPEVNQGESLLLQGADFNGFMYNNDFEKKYLDYDQSCFDHRFNILSNNLDVSD